MAPEKSESDITSFASSSPTSPKPPEYYVQSPSRDSQLSHDGYKSSTAQSQANTPSYIVQSQATTPSYATTQATPPSYSCSPMESPSHPSQSQARTSSASRISGMLRLSSARKWNRKGIYKWTTECNVIEEERDYDDDFYDDRERYTRRCHCLIALMGFAMVFTAFCLIIWGASRPYRIRVDVKSLTVNSFYSGEGSDFSGVPTKLLTVNCSVKMKIQNPATFFGIHVTSSPINLIYSQIVVGRGELKKYYQPRKSQRFVSVNLEGRRVPLYGAGPSLILSRNDGRVSLKLEFELRSRGNVVGKLVKTKHRRRVFCSFVTNTENSKVTKFKEDSCTYD